MNDTSATSASGMSLLPDGIGTLTAVHFTIIAVLAILVVIGLLWGIRAKHARVQAARDVIAHAEEAGVAPEPIAPEPDPAPVQQRSTTATQTQVQTNLQTPPAPSPRVDTPADVPTTPDRLADEPIAAAAFEANPAAEAAPPAPEPSPSPVPRPASTETATAYADGPVTQLKGLGPKVATRLGELGVTTVSQMAALSESEAQSIDAQLGNFTGRMGRDRWIEQARLLAAGDKAGFEAVFGKL